MHTGQFISPSGTSELDSATTKTDTAERSISIGRESLQVCLGNRRYGVLADFSARRQSWRNMARTGYKKAFCLGICQNWINCDGATVVSDLALHRTTYGQNNSWVVTRNSIRVAACALRNKQDGRGHRPRLSSVCEKLLPGALRS
jgi:hypothetical protein